MERSMPVEVTGVQTGPAPHEKVRNRAADVVVQRGISGSVRHIRISRLLKQQKLGRRQAATTHSLMQRCEAHASFRAVEAVGFGSQRRPQHRDISPGSSMIDRHGGYIVCGV